MLFDSKNIENSIITLVNANEIKLRCEVILRFNHSQANKDN